ncbi:MAG: sensor domain-containing diguanylate cyclase [Actinomycetota bacterium]|nr:sensor domain-containing diguanylate cyclase [Actinomycetota bacterium]
MNPEDRESDDELRPGIPNPAQFLERLPAVAYIAGFGEEGWWLYVSPQIETMLGFTPEEWTARPDLWFKQVHPEDRDRVLAEEEHDLQLGEEGPRRTEYRVRDKEGREVWVRDEAIIVRDVNRAPLFFQGLLTDITDEKEREARLKHLAFHDGLTGLPSREVFVDRVEVALKRTARAETLVGVLFLDLDDFKEVNDLGGHSAGDELLIAIAGRLQSSVRPGDTAARLGGDEFGVLVEELTSIGQALGLASRLMNELRQPFEIDGGEVSTRLTGGLAVGSMRTHTAHQLIRAADNAMYKSKREGKDRWSLADMDHLPEEHA